MAWLKINNYTLYCSVLLYHYQYLFQLKADKAISRSVTLVGMIFRGSHYQDTL